MHGSNQTISSFDFVFMLTRNDQTIADAEQHLETVLSAGIKHIGFKDVGLPFGDLKRLNDRIKKAGASSYLEVVSLDRESELTSAKAALELGVDYLLGGTRADEVAPLLKATPIKYYPFPGNVVGHPSILEGSIDEIVKSALKLSKLDGVDGLDLLGYRAPENAEEVIKAVCAAVSLPVLVAGSINSVQRIRAVHQAGAAAFTIGTAALDGSFSTASADLASQLAVITDTLIELSGRFGPN